MKGRMLCRSIRGSHGRGQAVGPPPTSAAPAGRRGLMALQNAASNVLVPAQPSCGNLTARTESSWRVSHEALGWTGWAACLETEPGETPAVSFSSLKQFFPIIFNMLAPKNLERKFSSH